ncbi:MAG: methionine aminotransferase [Cyclobacteriaceae bacterium]|nr:methionine aminotransferase [Cyclobacteriaceae bacterium]
MISSKLPNIGTSIFTVMSALATEYSAINLSQGFPDFPVDPLLIDRIHYYMKNGYNQYAPMPGVPVLKAEIAQMMERSYGRVTDPQDEVIVYSGATEGIFVTIQALISPGDEVIVFDPMYDSYDPVVRLAGGIPVHIALNPPDFMIPWQEVADRITPKTRAIIINTPHNPTGTMLSADDLKELSALANKHNLYVISDEVYHRIIFDGRQHESVLRYPELKDRSVAVFSFGKTFHATGWKIGYTVAGKAITNELRKIHQFVTFSVNTPIQYALADHLKDPANYLYLGEFFDKKRKRFLEGIKQTKFKPLSCSGTYFQLVSYVPEGNESDYDYAIRMTKENGVAAIPVSVFYDDQRDHHLLRFCFAKDDATLDKGLEILKTL